MNNIHPWLNAHWKNLIARNTSGNLPHALLFAGPPGIGKNDLANLFTSSILCAQTAADGLPCGECRGCRLVAAETHPDFVRVTPPEEGKVIGVDQIREVIRYLSLKAQYNGYKIVIITPADRMNMNAANSLLKTLEEPPVDTLLILVTEKPARLPATIRSRCQSILFNRPPADLALPWIKENTNNRKDARILLELAGGSPLLTVRIANEDYLSQRLAVLDDLEHVASGQTDPVAIADKWLKFGIKESLYWIHSWLIDMVRLKMAQQPPLVSNPDIYERLKNMANKQDVNQLFGRLDRISRAMQLLESTVNPQLLMEEIVLGWVPKQAS